jgi:hypothetical protein
MNIISSILLGGMILFNIPVVEKYEKPPVPEPPKVVYYEPTHQQKVYMYSLEWCESRGVQSAINPKDKDGTPSYYSFQFKPTTFERYRVRYNIPEAHISDYPTQWLIVSQMLNDKSVRWDREFPDCVKRLGYPPKPINGS